MGIILQIYSQINIFSYSAHDGTYWGAELNGKSVVWAGNTRSTSQIVTDWKSLPT